MPSPQNREEVLLAAALEISADKRDAFLKDACLGDPALRQRLKTRLAAHDNPEPLPPAVAATIKLDLAEAGDEAVGRTIGRYKVLEKIGEGGCGVVYVAEQTEPVRRRVALKVIKLGMDTKQVVARFEAERQALAMMDHPNIAKVLDAGATETGRPFFVMELVRGIKITEYCDQANLTTKERIDLFIKVCQAIQHAHQKGIIHRDIKPSNILVTLHDGAPVPKVIDFGIAKATAGQTLTDKTVYTQLQQFIGTPAYMSPEQAEMSGLDIDTRSDIYSLGVLLYELLAGSTPFDSDQLAASGIDAMRKTIREKDPVRPSTRLATLTHGELTTTAKRRSTETSKLLHQLKGDLDWIVMKCLEKDRARRYETANGLAFDLKRHLDNEPVLARPPGAAYKFQKAFRRNRLVFSAVLAIAAALLLGIIVSAWQSVLATRAKHEALAAQAQAVEAQANESKLRQQADQARRQAEAAELAARRRAYASDMNVAMQALDGSNLGRAQDLLNRQRPQPGQKDLRGWEWRYLWQQTHSDALSTLCQKTEIESLAASADGNWLAIGVVHKDGLFVYDLRTRQEAAHLAPGESEVRSAFSPLDSLLAFTSVSAPVSVREQSTLRLWNPLTREVVSQFPLDHPCEGLAFARDGRTLVTSTGLGHITLWRIPGGTKLASYPSEQELGLNPATGFAATSDLGLAAYGTRTGQIRIMDLHDGKQLWSAVASRLFVTALAFSPDGKTLASAAGFAESDIRLWDVATGIEIGRLKGHKSWVGSLAFWPDGKALASCSADQTMRIWDLASRKCLDVMQGHRLEVWRLALLPDGKTLVSGCKDGTVCLWDAAVTHPHQSLITVPAKIRDWCFSPDSRSLVTLDNAGQVARWSGPDFQEREAGLHIGPSYAGSSFSPDGRLLAVGFTKGNISVWDVSRRVLRREFKVGDGSVYPENFLSQGNRLVVRFAADNHFSEWDLEANREIQSWPAPYVSLRGFSVSPDERLGVCAGFNGDVSGRILSEHSSTNLPLDVLEAVSVAFSPDGTRLAISSHLGYARVWDTGTCREEATLRGFLNAVNAAVFSPDGKRLATGGSNPDDAVKLWDVDSWQELLTLEGAGSLFDLTSFSPDGNAIGTLSGEGLLNIWRAPSWEEINAAEAKEKAAIKQP
ncbi:MAG: serine/threonine-protein kinase [Verrucomicrobiota bacterium]|jgi:WD40 repeat protein/tRNA A-37 threonylcarbamoyl transferase component Bud32